MRERFFNVLTAVVFCIWCLGALIFLRSFPTPHFDVVRASGANPSIVYAIVKAESGFHADAVSGKGAVGLMQLMPSTAQFICEREGIEFFPERLKEERYNLRLGCAYITYLSARFSCVETAIAAYNAGEGTVGRWLTDERFSSDGRSLKGIPYSETQGYVKKVKKFLKIYKIVCD